MLFPVSDALAQGGLPKTTGKPATRNGKENGCVAIIKPGTGLVTVKIWPGTNLDPTLSYADKSFVTFQVNGTKYYTNNDIGLAPFPANTSLLSDGVLTKVGDTVRCVWYNKEGVDLIQENWPVKLEQSVQIVYRWKAINHNVTPTAVSVQYLLDNQVVSNDGSPILTRYGYRPNWAQFAVGSPSADIPWFYIAFENTLPNSPRFNPGLGGQGYTDNSYFNFGLTRPTKITIGDWNNLIQSLWGWPFSLPNGKYVDVAMLFEFNPAYIPTDKETIIASTSYGTGEFEECHGQLFSVVFYPHRIKWIDPNLVPNPFNLEMYTFNASPTTSASNTSITLTVGRDLTILSPSPVLKAGKVQTQQVAGGGNIPPLGVGITSWSLQAEKEDCLGDIRSTVNFTASSSIGFPVFINDIDPTDTCYHELIIECAQLDFLAPLAVNQTNPDKLTKTIDAKDNRTKDRGLKSITWAPLSGTDPSKFDISFSPPLTGPCDKAVHTITIKQLDSTIGGCFDFTLVDCVNLRTDTTICFGAHPVTPTPDTLPPVFSVLERASKYDTLAGDCNYQFDSILVTDNRLLDSGLLAVKPFGTPVNMNFSGLPVVPGVQFYRYSVNVVDPFKNGSIIVEAEDVAHHKAYDTVTYCTQPDTNKPIVIITPIPNTRGQWTVSVSEQKIWDRLINEIFVTTPTNIYYPDPPNTAPPVSLTAGKSYYEFRIFTQDTSKPSSFCVEANDSAGNLSARQCRTQSIDPDQLAPNITITPDTSTNPWKVTVNINDIHTDGSGNVVPWDKGVDSVWIVADQGITVPANANYPCVKTVGSFDLTVIDTLSLESTLCATIYARDCALNISSSRWCYKVTPDTKPPVIIGKYTTRANIDFTINDNLLSDRGNGTMDLVNEINLTPTYSNIDLGRKPSFQGPSLSRATNSSSIGTVRTVDYWGNNASGANKLAHTASVDFGIYVQNAEMKKGLLIRKPGDFELPIKMVFTDSFDLVKKGINEYEFKFVMNGDAFAIKFKSAITVGTMSEGWTVTPTVTGNTVDIHAWKPVGGMSLPDTSNRKLTAPLLTLQFTAQKDESTRDVTLDIINMGNESILYNNGQDTTYVGQNAVATMPATYGTLSGSHIVILGACAPSLLKDGAKPTSVSLNQNSPNPFNGKTHLTYTVPEEGSVRLAVYDMLGKRITTLVDDVQAQGSYAIDFDGYGLDGGNYVVRLETNGTVRSRQMVLQK